MAAYGQSELITPRRANSNTIQDKFLVGYQGWFTCAGDGPPVHNGHHGWLHWSNIPLPDGGHPTIDAWPDTSTYSPSELYPVPGLVMEDGSSACLFSSRHPKTVRRHFNWMAIHGVDGAFLQRFAGQLEVDGNRNGAKADLTRLRDEIGDRVREAAEAEGRVFAIMYDVSGVPADRIEKVIKVDWEHLIRDQGVLDSPAYLREKGRPVIGLWGFGFDKAHHPPDVLRRIVRHLRSHTPGGAYIFAGTPTHWRTLRADSDPNPEWLDVWYNEVDAISPWAVGRFHNEETIERFWEEKVRPDMKAVSEENAKRGRQVDYVPVVLPGSSGWNVSGGKWAFNDAKRNGGKFLWRQIYNVKQAGVRIVYGAMWDEYDEGTNFLPMVASKRLIPNSTLDRSFKFVSGDIDGFDLPPDWYMRIAGLLGEGLRGEREVEKDLPVKALWDYWKGRPKRQTTAGSSSGSGSGPAALPQASGSHAQIEEVSSSSGHTGYDTAALLQTDHDDGHPEVPPPPYSLIAEDVPSATGPTSTILSTGLEQGISALALVSSPIQEEQGPPIRRNTRPTARQHGTTGTTLSHGSSSSTSSEHNVPPPLPSVANRPRTSAPTPSPRTDSPTLPPPQHPTRVRTPLPSIPGGTSARMGAILAPPQHPSSASRASSPARPSLSSHSSTMSSTASQDGSPISVSVETVECEEEEVPMPVPRPSLDATGSRSNRNSGIYNPTYVHIVSPVPSPSPSPVPSPVNENADLEPNPYPYTTPQSPPPVPRKSQELRLSQSGISLSTMPSMPSPPPIPLASRPPSNYVPYNSRPSLNHPGSPELPSSSTRLGPYGLVSSPSSPNSPENDATFATAQDRMSNPWVVHGSAHGDDPRFHHMPQPHPVTNSPPGHPGRGPSMDYSQFGGGFPGYEPNQPQWSPQPFPQQFPVQQPVFMPQGPPPPAGYYPSYGVVQDHGQNQAEGQGERSIVNSISNAGSKFLNKFMRF